MILFMAILTSLTGYGLGILLVTVAISTARSLMPYYAATITFWNLAPHGIGTDLTPKKRRAR